MIYFKIIAPKELFRLINCFFFSACFFFVCCPLGFRNQWWVYWSHRHDVTPSSSRFYGKQLFRMKRLKTRREKFKQKETYIASQTGQKIKTKANDATEPEIEGGDGGRANLFWLRLDLLFANVLYSWCFELIQKLKEKRANNRPINKCNKFANIRTDNHRYSILYLFALALSFHRFFFFFFLSFAFMFRELFE